VTATPLIELPGKTVPQSGAPQLSVHVTPLPASSPMTVAVNSAVVPANTVTGSPAGAMVISIPGSTIVPVTKIAADPDAPASVTDVAVIVTASSPVVIPDGAV
jgi:hypothetical protein